MAHDQNRDRNLVSSEPYEVEYIHQQFKGHSHQEVVSALESCKMELGGSDDREKIMECMRRKLS